MPEMFKVRPPQEALARLLACLTGDVPEERLSSADGLGRVLTQALVAGSPLPAFVRSTMDGYAVRSADTFGATESLPAYLTLAGEVPMGREAEVAVSSGQVVVIHTGGMVPPGADAVVPVEQTQRMGASTVEVLRPVAPGENTVGRGEDVKEGEPLFTAGHVLRAQDLGGLMALGITEVQVAARPRVAILSTGDEIVAPHVRPAPGQVRDINTYTVAGLVTQGGGLALPRGIVADDAASLLEAARAALAVAEVLVISAGSSVSVRDLTADVINRLGAPGVLVHGVAIKPGKPTILGVCEGKPVIGLPGNPVSAMVASRLFLGPLLRRLQGATQAPPQARATARLARNVASAPGREDYVPVRLDQGDGQVWAHPVLGKSNLIYTLVKADGLVVVPLDANGIHQGETVEVELF